MALIPGGKNNLPNATRVYTREQGQSKKNVHTNGHVPAARGLNPNDRQSAISVRNKSLYHAANKGAGRMSMRGSVFGQNVISQSGGLDSTTKALMYTKVALDGAKTIFGALKDAGILGGTKTDGTKGPATMSSISLGSGPKSVLTGEALSSLNAMQSANDSTALSAAIQNAQAQYNLVSLDVSDLQAQIQDSKPDHEAAKTAMNEAKQTMESKEAVVKEKEQSVKMASDKVSSFETKLQSAENNLSMKDSAFKAANANLATAQGAVKTAEATLAATPQTITDSTGQQVSNPAYDLAKQAVETAKEQESQALQAKEDALQALETAQGDVKEAKEAVDTAAKNLEKAETDKKTADGELETAQKELTKAQGEFEKQKEIVDSYEKLEADLDKKQKEAEELSREISSQEGRLVKMREKEEKESARLGDRTENLQGRINERSAQIDESDGFSKKELRLQARNERDNASVSNMMSSKDGIKDGMSALDSRTLSALKQNGISLGEFVVKDGVSFQAFASGTFNVNGKEVSSDQFFEMLKNPKAALDND